MISKCGTLRIACDSCIKGLRSVILMNGSLWSQSGSSPCCACCLFDAGGLSGSFSELGQSRSLGSHDMVVASDKITTTKWQAPLLMRFKDFSLSCKLPQFDYMLSLARSWRTFSPTPIAHPLRW
eukprot:736014-Amphidinium_carterae.1